MIMNEFLDTTDYMVQGHEGWLAPCLTHVHEGDDLDVFFCWGHNMKPHGLARNEDLFVYAVTPDGEKQDLQLMGNTEDHYTYRMKMEKKGLYHFVSQKTGYYCKNAEGKRLNGTLKDNSDAVSATRYQQYAHMALAVGHGLETSDYSETPAIPLRIVPDCWDKFQTGEIFAFTLFFGDKPLSLCDIDIAYTAGDDEATHEEIMTDGEGRITYPIKAPGKYLVVVRCTVPEGEEGLYYDTRYTYTFWFKVKR